MAGTFFIEDAIVISVYAEENAGSTYHKGAGAQELIVMVCRLLSNAFTVLRRYLLLTEAVLPVLLLLDPYH